ncbi:MAG: sulfur relay protein DsrC [Candidatus Muproteobacteria bacterium RIFCSPHIGHO2_12_FULL_60_33]|uniref:Sulfur relay protein DsrC n=1 Tax=Candidatus Muproteobacteria bacterium RIFCSPLOWO2_01_FULL_60_18 TaxID=1817768 RepID=A0A1F6TY67_9PROT|nr:MAG: sulfur relay protein DsrC [Candidatus Muproteobacteria bacterium RIFCSPHIGHO2_01_60_12]OGI50050.1 MAG: sulfur relay protein DsrC [Candidatus Muproteobacteria bacterium RIFCSPLOWO2_01_FULL_60_18]OGI55101.1 MAG: sulfur relay protein DsrC [Candidatus Muproteobacteria bacterium RIFCSPHIGHO2_12_FULL_60_33]OGI56907.1 MAG: sulfur relay protein DsrC [Candidatus Muproteobacteria bacterium RIFCSPHIGHO2_02_FULL_60_13]OGI57744.1 MAG: sulfur relay protein DsrC [Candidatus Muproteobacteria bacterium 
MSYEFNGKTIDTDANGFLANTEDWSKELAEHIAQREGVPLTPKHWDIIEYLRDAYFNQNGEQPNTRHIVKAMSDKWGTNVSQKDVYDLFPKDPSKQGGRISGLPESRRKGGY